MADIFLTSKTIVVKQSGELINAGFDLDNWLDAGVTINTPVVSHTPDGLTIGSPTVSGQRILFTVSGGTNGTLYRIEVSFNTSEGESLIADGKLKVRNR